MSPLPESLEDLEQNPNKYGMPTLDEFSRNREKYMGREDDEIAAIDAGDPALGCRQKYYVEHYRVDSLEQAQRIALDMGLNLFHDFIVDPQLRTDSGGGFYNEVRFRSKRSIAERESW